MRKQIRFSLASILLLIFLSTAKIYSAPGDTTWVTTFNQEFQNWADVHYNNYILHDSVRLGSYIESWIGGTRGWLVTVKFAFIEGEILYKPFQVININQNHHVIYGDPADPPSAHLPLKTVMIDPQTVLAKSRVT